MSEQVNEQAFVEKPDKTKGERVKNTVLVLLLVALSGLLCAFAVSEFIASVNVISGESMEPTLSDGNAVIAEVVSIDEINRYDIIIFRKPEMGALTYIVKRVYAMENDLVTIKDGVLYVNDEAVEVKGVGKLEDMPLAVVPAGMFFVMGDNLSNSNDSRRSEFGFAEYRYTKGRVTYRLFPDSGNIN